MKPPDAGSIPPHGPPIENTIGSDDEDDTPTTPDPAAKEAGECDDKPDTEWDETHGTVQTDDPRCSPINKDMSNHWLTHMPMRTDCPACQRAKMKQQQRRRVTNQSTDKLPSIPVTKFGDLVTMDHSNSSLDDSIEGENYGLLMADKRTSFLALYPCVEKSARDVQWCLRDFEGPTDYINMVYSDNAPEFVTAVKSQSKLHETSTPHKSETNS